MRNQQGFTLIELIIVIIILGILAVTAAPKFADMQSDAKVSTINGLAGALKGAGNIVYAKAALSGLETGSQTTVEVGGGTLATENGYPAATQAALQQAADIPSSDWTFVAGSGAAAVAANPASGTIGLHAGGTVDFTETGSSGTSCHLTYTPPSSAGSAPVIDVVTGGC